MDTWIQFTIALTCVLTMLTGSILGLIKLGMSIGSLRKQVTPNGGHTDMLGDRVVRLEHSQKMQSEALDRIEAMLAQLPCRPECKMGKRSRRRKHE